MTHPAESVETADTAAVIARYKQRYRMQDALAALLNAMLRRFVSGTERAPRPFRRILLANAGHLGDALMSMSLVPALKDAFPGASFAFLTSSYARPAVDGHPLLERAHYLDHWFAARTKSGLLRRVRQYYSESLPSMVAELRAAEYDVALDLHAWFPNYIPLLHRTGIPVRIGFDRLGLSAFLTRSHAYGYDRRHEVSHYCDLLRLMGVPDSSLRRVGSAHNPVTATVADGIHPLLAGFKRFRVLHPGSSTPVKDWSLQGWSELARRLVESGVTPVITGAGARDQSLANEICSHCSRAVSLVNKVSWQQLQAVLSAAELVYAADTSVGHAAAALGRPVVSIFGGMADPQHWAPLGARVVTHAMPCSPCFDKRGCAHRSCLMKITVEDVERAADELMPGSKLHAVAT